MITLHTERLSYETVSSCLDRDASSWFSNPVLCLSLTQKHLCDTTGRARGQILDGTQGSTTLLHVFKSLRLHDVR